MSPFVPGTTPASWRVFTAAPHRVMFLGGTLQLIATVVFWAAELTGRYSALWAPLPVVIPAGAAHGFLMLYALFLFFVFGFLMTTFPRWTNGPPIARSRYLAVFGLLALGVVAFYLGLFLHRALALGGIGMLLAGWAGGIGALARVVRATPRADHFYERLLLAAHGAGWLGAAAFALWVADPGWMRLDISVRAGLWLFLAPVFLTVCHRMVPFFTESALSGERPVRRLPRALLPVLLAGLAAHGVLEMLHLETLTWIADLPLAALLAVHARAWTSAAALRIPLLAVLHVAFLVLVAAMALYSAHGLALYAGDPAGLGRGPLHLLTIGFFAAMVLGMATRVSLGHSGRALEMDQLSWWCYWGLVATAVIRALADTSLLARWPQLNLLAAIGWLACVSLWAGRYLPVWLRPRIDGRPG